VQIVVNHLTRMRTQRICIAGIDLERGCHVRPVTPKADLLTRDLLTENGGPLELARSSTSDSPRQLRTHPRQRTIGFAHAT